MSVDRDRVIGKIDQLRGYVETLRRIAPADLDGYEREEIKRACERLLQIAVEAAIDTCGLLVSGLQLGLPGEEDDMFDKLEREHVIDETTTLRLRSMKGLRNILVHEYARVDDRRVFEAARNGLSDLDRFADQITSYLRGLGSDPPS